MTSRISEPQRAAARQLLSAALVRRRAQQLLRLARSEELDDWRVDETRLAPAAAYVAQVVRDRYPHLDPPFHSRWRHFVFGGRDLWQELDDSRPHRSVEVRTRSAFDLAITSVLLDAGAGPSWRYRDAPTGLVVGRSEGLALASLRWFACGGLSADPADPLRADAAKLCSIDRRTLEDALQVTPDNPLAGLEGRAALLNRLGGALQSRPELFARGDSPRPGGLFDTFVMQAKESGGTLLASGILDLVLDGLGAIWRDRPMLDGVALGDCWPHPALHARATVPADGYVPLHKLSQWLSYSLIEPLQQAGVRVHDVDSLTGLAEYRNGGLLVDTGVLAPRRRADLAVTHSVDSPLVVGWRALTVALLDELAPLVRTQLGISVNSFPLTCLLEGGTWAAGRKIAAERRAGGGPPLQIISDGTVF